jgi:hypothetical protein
VKKVQKGKNSFYHQGHKGEEGQKDVRMQTNVLVKPQISGYTFDNEYYPYKM